MFIEILKVTKLFSAILLAITLTMPLSKCERSNKQGGKEVSYQYVISKDNITDPGSWLGLVFFLLPLLLVCYRLLRKVNILAVLILDVLVPIPAGAVLFSIVLFNTPLIGSDIAATAIGVYFSAAAVELVLCLYRKYQLRTKPVQ